MLTFISLEDSVDGSDCTVKILLKPSIFDCAVSGGSVKNHSGKC